MEVYYSRRRSSETPMKKLSLLALSIFSALSSAGAQTTVSTDPVGFVSSNVAAGTLANPKLSFVSPTLQNPIVWQSVITGASANTLTVAGTPWTAGQFNGASGSYYVEVFSPTDPGAIGKITATAANSISTEEDLSQYAMVGDSIRIRKYVTLADFFGVNNSAGLLAGEESPLADEVLIYNGATFKSSFYYVGDPDNVAGWYDSSTFLPSGNFVIAPHQGVIIKRKTTGTPKLTFAGAVKTGNTLLPVYNGVNVIGTVSAMGLTLNSSGLYTGAPNTFKAGEEAPDGDEVTIFTVSGQTNYYYYVGDPDNAAGWRNSATFAVAGNIIIEPGSAFIIKRKGAGTSFYWTLPSPSTF